MIELIVSGLPREGGKAAVETAVGAVDPSAHAEVDAAGQWVRIASCEPAIRFVSAMRAAGVEALVWWDGSPAPARLPADFQDPRRLP